MIRAENLSKSFGETRAVRSVSFHAEDGAITGLLGPNGSGKTTTLRLLTGILRPDEGRAHLDGVEVRGSSTAGPRLGVLSESRPLYPRRTAAEHLAYFGALRGLSGTELATRVEAVVEALDLGSLASRRARGFSLGEKSRLALGCALVHDPPNLILDEPTNGLDVTTIRALRALLRRLRDSGKCILLASHVMQEVSALCDAIVVLTEGRVAAAGTPGELLERSGRPSLEDLLIGLADGEEAAP